MPTKRPKKYTNVEIQFNLNLEETEEEGASVVLRGEEMVIDIRGLDGKKLSNSRQAGPTFLCRD